jgi:hypothetical protein
MALLASDLLSRDVMDAFGIASDSEVTDESSMVKVHIMREVCTTVNCQPLNTVQSLNNESRARSTIFTHPKILIVFEEFNAFVVEGVCAWPNLVPFDSTFPLTMVHLVALLIGLLSLLFCASSANEMSSLRAKWTPLSVMNAYANLITRNCTQWAALFSPK